LEAPVHSGRVFITLVFLIVVVVEAIGYRQYRSDMAAWRAVEQSLGQLRAALEHAPAVKLAPQIDSAREAIDDFTASPHRFPRDRHARLEAADRGLQYLDLAAKGVQNIRNWEGMAAYPDVTKLLPRGCDGDHLAFSPALISEAFGVAGSYFIKEATSGATDKERFNWQQGFYPPLDLAKENAACQLINRATTRLAATTGKTNGPRRSAKWKYEIDVSNPTGCLMTPYSDDQAIPIPHSQIYHFHLDAQRQARLEQVFCNADKPGDAITVSINGQSYDAVWLLDGSGINYTTQLAPRAPLAMSPSAAAY
jgi:hypothetical protein